MNEELRRLLKIAKSKLKIFIEITKSTTSGPEFETAMLNFKKSISDIYEAKVRQDARDAA